MVNELTIRSTDSLYGEFILFYTDGSDIEKQFA